MKKFVVTLCLFLISPFYLLCYSENIILGGQNVGISINSKGLIVVGFYKVAGKYIANDTFKVGDIILEVEGESVDSISSMSKAIEPYTNVGKVNLLIERKGSKKNVTLDLVYEGNMYKTGLYVKDKVNGIGTLTYIDPETKIYGALGHEIIMNETDYIVEVKSGNIYESYVTGIDRSIDGTVGSKNATINFSNTLGDIKKNTKYGIYGMYEGGTNSFNTIEVADIDEVKLGEAKILTILKDKTIKEYIINITDFNTRKVNTNKSISFEIKDKELLDKTGGIVQGMSGSPIIQNGRIIGAVTHVVVDDVSKGYGIFIRTMLEEGEK